VTGCKSLKPAAAEPYPRPPHTVVSGR
jgi:hypothetical protein